MIKITPITFPLGDLVGTNFNLYVNSFPLNATTATFYYLITTDDGIEILRGNIEMTEAEFTGWSNDNNYCIDWALVKLGLSRLE